MNVNNASVGVVAVIAIVGASFVAGMQVVPVREVAVPGPTVYATPMPAPPPQVVEIPGPTVTITPEVCLSALDGVVDLLGAEGDMLGRYFDGKEPTEEQVARFVALDLARIFGEVDDCRAAAEPGL